LARSSTCAKLFVFAQVQILTEFRCRRCKSRLRASKLGFFVALLALRHGQAVFFHLRLQIFGLLRQLLQLMIAWGELFLSFFSARTAGPPRGKAARCSRSHLDFDALRAGGRRQQQRRN
jgi:hypothetical protein